MLRSKKGVGFKLSAFGLLSIFDLQSEIFIAFFFFGACCLIVSKSVFVIDPAKIIEGLGREFALELIC